MSRQQAVSSLVALGALMVLGVGRAPAQCELQKLFLPDGQSTDVFGSIVALDGDVTVIGLDSSAFPNHVYHRLGGAWIDVQKLVATNPPGGSLGGAVSLSGDVALVSASGGAFVFRRQGNAWFEEAVLTDPGGGGTFGVPVAVDGDVALVAFPLWIFRFDGSEWVPEQELVQPDPPAVGFDAFGVHLALSGDVAVVSAYARTETVGLEGALYVYRRIGSTWTMEQKLLASDPVGSDYLGWSVAVEGDVIVAGAIKQFGCPIPEKQEFCEPGAAYVFRYDGNAWIEEQKLVPSDGGRNDQFGDAVDISGDTIVVGAPFHEAEGLSNTGAAYVYHWDGAIWTERQKLMASDLDNSHRFGDALAVSGDTAIIGAKGADGNEPRSGAAYVFAVAGDCNANGQIDACEALADPSLDLNGNLILDHCEGIPAVSHWGLALSALLLLTAGSILIHRRRIRIA